MARVATSSGVEATTEGGKEGGWERGWWRGKRRLSKRGEHKAWTREGGREGRRKEGKRNKSKYVRVRYRQPCSSSVPQAMPTTTTEPNTQNICIISSMVPGRGRREGGREGGRG